MSEISNFESSKEKEKRIQLNTFSFNKEHMLIQENRQQQISDQNNSTQLVLKEKSTNVSNWEEDKLKNENESFILDQQMIEEQQNKFLLDDDSNDPNVQFEINDDVSEVGEVLFSPKTNCMQTEVGSHFADIADIAENTIGIPSINGWQSFINSNYGIFQTDPLSKSQIRRQKVERYFLKRQNRCFRKKIHYHSRKTVAESRLRVKGRFITKSKAERILGVDLSNLCNKEIKQLLEHHYAHG